MVITKFDQGVLETQIKSRTSTERIKTPKCKSMCKHVKCHDFWTQRDSKVAGIRAWLGENFGMAEQSHFQGTSMRSSGVQEGMCLPRLNASASSFHIPGICWMVTSMLWMRWKREKPPICDTCLQRLTKLSNALLQPMCCHKQMWLQRGYGDPSTSNPSNTLMKIDPEVPKR